MIRNYFITAFRNLARQKGYSLIIILGLTISIAVFSLIILYVNNEHQTDKFNKNYDQIYRLETENWAILGTAYGPELAANFPEIKDFARVSSIEGSSVTIKKDDELLKMENMIYADSAFIKIFTFKFLHGNPKQALSAPYSLILTESEARKIFGNINPVGNMLKINKNEFTVTGVIEDIPRFHLKTRAIASFHTLRYIYNDSNFLNKHDTWNYYTFFHLTPNTNPKQLEQKIIDFYTGKANWKDSKPTFLLRPLRDIYFTHVKYDVSPTSGNRSMLFMFLSIAIFIVIIACVNFINLTTARSATRSKEIGLRKALGAHKKNLVLQFLGEAVLITFISTELALVLMELLRPVFNNLVGKEIAYGNDLTYWLIALAIPFPIIIGIISGIYPAFYLNRFRPVSSLKKERTTGKGALAFRRILITVQFAISIFLTIATLTVYKQLTYIREKDLGFEKEHIITMNLNNEINKQTFRERLLSEPSIKSVAFSTQHFGNISWQESIPVNDEFKQFTFLGTEPELIQTMGLEVIQGRPFSRSHPSDEGKVILNEEAVKYFDLKNPVGTNLGSEDRKLEVIGVMKNTYFNSLHSPIAPLIMMWRENLGNSVSIQISGLPDKSLEHIRNVWNDMSGNYIFEYKFLDESFDQLYKSEARLAQLFMYLAILAIFIASIGLFGLASYLSEQRTKEIGIRKVLGASDISILRLLSGEFIKWVVLAGVIAIPLAWIVMNNWLNKFAYHTNVDALILITACAVAIVITITSVSWQAYRTASKNPVDALRYE